MIQWEKIKTLEELKQAKNQIYGDNSEFQTLQNKVRSASPEEKKELGKQLSELKKFYEQKIKEAEAQIERYKLEEAISKEFVDVTTPVHKVGTLHPITLIENKLRDWFYQNGYFEATAGEITTDLYNFEKLNIPQNHPARDMQDSLYINEKILLRTHNTGISAQELEKRANQPANVFAIGKVYRNDEDDTTHSHQFTQLDFISVGNVSFANLKWTLESLLSYVFETQVKVRMRPSYFPFTEPSVEVDVFYKNKWIEILGAGMIHKNVLRAAGYTNNMSAFAAGIGLERLAMIKYEIKNIREFYKNDLRTLNQFNNR
ncbi:phenylalanine--tRNA ligase subunit alpha [Mycoplasmopsis columbinasalis]|uniref:phenylalanine--tRNA ligase n=1 Tax=Mycoplasmopsis columbinasalis TaxID=114880 RepID=A0A449BAI9_9BACT|nr:phenylalanine--tRNA ligase subunit alpha [Mycoplasmopsis columbinasalis]VEU78213.1 phenylalanyl-tRNA synthetase subunit alpha [Mycoplasmopsis columbinasalis]